MRSIEVGQIHLEFSELGDMKFKASITEEISIRKQVERVINYCNRLFGFKNLLVTLFYDREKWSGESMSVCGSASESDISVCFNPSYGANFISDARKLLPAVVSHEFGHFARANLVGRPGNFLVDRIADEGTAICFQRSLFPGLRTFEERFSEEFNKILCGQVINDIQQGREGNDPVQRWYYGQRDLPAGSIHAVSAYIVGSIVKKQDLSLREIVTLTTEKIKNHMMQKA